MNERGKQLWEPSAERVEQATITRYMRWLESERGLRFSGYEDLYEWSVTELEAFWASIWDFFDVRASTPYERVLAERTMPGARWFEGAELNYAEHVLRDKPGDAVAVYYASEHRALSELRWDELREQVARTAAGLRALGVERGDRVAAYVPNTPEALVGFLATASIGAVWSSCSPDFGSSSVIDRFAQIEPKVLIASPAYSYGGKEHDRSPEVSEIAAAMPEMKGLVLVRLLDEMPNVDVACQTMSWEELLSSAEGAELEFEQVPFDHPLWILYSSGTTGLPKAIVHGHGGILLEHLKKMNLHVDAGEGDRVFWFTTTGWMMWNFLVSILLTPASIVLYDGSPGHPDTDGLWELAARSGTTCFGTSASYIAACMKAGVEPGAGRDLAALDAVGSTGSPLAPEGFEWVYEHVGADIWLFSTSGGTDLCTAFVGGVPLLPVYRGELQARTLGAKVEAWDDDGNSLTDAVGELVLTEPMPSMPLFFWGDEDGSRYRDAYFDHYPGVWRHGDWIEITSRGTAIIYGRSDSTINRQGVRMGTSEIYRAVQAIPEVTDALVVDVPRPGTEGWMPLFVVLDEGVALDDDLVGRIKRSIREQCSPRHVPNEVYALAEVPRTLSGKVLEVPVKRILMGTPIDQAASRDSLANPAALDPFVELARELETSS